VQNNIDMSFIMASIVDGT